MILKLSLTVLLLYYLVVLWKYYRQDIAGIFGTAETDEDTEGTGKEPGQPGEPYTVMGESTYLPFGAEDGEEAAAGAVDEPAAEDDGADYSDIEPEEDEEETDYEPTPEEIREYRGTLTEPGKNSPYRDRTPEENLALFRAMKNGEFERSKENGCTDKCNKHRTEDPDPERAGGRRYSDGKGKISDADRSCME